MTDIVPAAKQPEMRERSFPLTVMGRTLEHLGTQMYKRRDAAIAELVANAWDAGAHKVAIFVGDAASYDQAKTAVTVIDDGVGMNENDVEHAYLVVGRNRRAEGQGDAPGGRRPMGRKGIGKLAGFGLAKSMRVETWQDGGQYCDLTLDVVKLKRPAGMTDKVEVPGRVAETAPGDVPWGSGTRLTLTGLKHKTHVDPEVLRQSLARRFSRTVRGEMEILVNGDPVEEPSLDFDLRVPAGHDEWAEDGLSDGTKVRYWYGFTEKVIPTTQLRGWTILVRGKTAQAPNFFFFVEGTASGQHGTKYMTGVIEADDLDAGDDDESDLVSTDRQELDWEDERTQALRDWGDRLTRDALRARANRRGDRMEKRIDENPALRERIERLDPSSQKRVRTYIRTLGQADADDEKGVELAEQLVLAFEYQHFHDVLEELDEEDPEQMTQILERLHDWKVLESRAILEVVQGRLQIIDKLAALLANDAPETAHRVGDENLHDLLADYPWIINPEWQVLAEEKTITAQLREWGEQDAEDADAKRYDFLALKGDGRLKIIEIKRQSHAVTLKEVQRLEEYKARLETAAPIVDMVLISGGEFTYNFGDREDIERLTWADIHSRTKTFYEHYRAVLTGDISDPDFDRRTREVQRTRSVIEHGAYRGRDLRKDGLGVQDVEHDALHLPGAVPAENDANEDAGRASSDADRS